ncbi:hypothetical protein IH992_20495 [Candidatus Poribacteria bacterium]|nr:hypothetical protein [Candidatus Poribacteria bacterium]
MRKLSLLGIIILILICHSLDAATIHVDINNVGQEDGTQTQPFNTIQEGIDQARDGDTVLVNDGRYVDRGNINLSFEGKAIIVKSVNGPSATIIDCENLDDTKGFIFNTHETTSSVLDGFTITNGNARSFGGGAIFCSSSPLITNCVIMGNTANDNGGGGIIFDGSSAVITNSIIAANTANYGGGIVCVSGAEPTIINCTITGNQAISGEGGGMAFFGLGNRLSSRTQLSGGISEPLRKCI